MKRENKQIFTETWELLKSGFWRTLLFLAIIALFGFLALAENSDLLWSK